MAIVDFPIALQERIESTTEQSTTQELDDLDRDLAAFPTPTKIRLVFELNGGPRECKLIWHYGSPLFPDDEGISCTETLADGTTSNARLCDLGFTTAVQTASGQTRFVIALAALQHSHDEPHFTLCWLLSERQYALVYGDLFPPGHDGSDFFWPKERRAHLPTTTAYCSFAVLEGSLFLGPAIVQHVEEGGLILGITFKTDNGMRADFGRVTFDEEQRRYRS